MRDETALTLEGGLVLTDTGLAPGTVHITDGWIVAQPAAGCERIDCRGLTLLPGIIDVHGDAFERELHPRPGVDIAFPIAMAAVDRLLVSNGITTAYHGLTLSWEPGARSLASGRAFMANLAGERCHFVADHRIQLRWETFAHDAVADVVGWLGTEPTPAVAFNDHTTSTVAKVAAGNHKKLGQWAERAGVTPTHYLHLVDAASTRRGAVAAAITAVAEAARAAGAIMLSHDDERLDERASYRSLGATVAEFPLALDVARDAVANGEHVVLGAPNVIRGGSHNGALSAEDAIRDGLCTVLASDYYYPSLFHAAEHLVKRGALPLAEAWRLISESPALAMGLTDRGQIGLGKRADLVLANLNDRWSIQGIIAGGRLLKF